MSTPAMLTAVRDYLALRRSFGYVLAGQDGPLADFASYLDRAGLGTVTVQAALTWAVEAGATPLRHYQRLAMVRGFTNHLLASHRPQLRGPAQGPAARGPPTGPASYLQRRRGRRADEPQPSPAPSPAGRHNRNGHRAVGGDRHALWGTGPPWPWRRRPRGRPLEGNRHEVQQIEGAGTARLDGGGARRLPPRS